MRLHRFALLLCLATMVGLLSCVGQAANGSSAVWHLPSAAGCRALPSLPRDVAGPAAPHDWLAGLPAVGPQATSGRPAPRTWPCQVNQSAPGGTQRSHEHLRTADFEDATPRGAAALAPLQPTPALAASPAATTSPAATAAAATAAAAPAPAAAPLHGPSDSGILRHREQVVLGWLGLVPLDEPAREVVAVMGDDEESLADTAAPGVIVNSLARLAADARHSSGQQVAERLNHDEQGLSRPVALPVRTVSQTELAQHPSGPPSLTDDDFCSPWYARFWNQFAERWATGSLSAELDVARSPRFDVPLPSAELSPATRTFESLDSHWPCLPMSRSDYGRRSCDEPDGPAPDRGIAVAGFDTIIDGPRRFLFLRNGQVAQHNEHRPVDHTNVLSATEPSGGIWDWYGCREWSAEAERARAEREAQLQAAAQLVRAAELLSQVLARAGDAILDLSDEIHAIAQVSPQALAARIQSTREEQSAEVSLPADAPAPVDAVSAPRTVIRNLEGMLLLGL